VQEQVLQRRAARQRAAVHRDALPLGVGLRARLEPDAPVDGDPSRREQPFSCSP
jgi:hypothetical protein